MITKLRLKYQSHYKSFFGARRLILSTTLKTFVLIVTRLFLSVFFLQHLRQVNVQQQRHWSGNGLWDDSLSSGLFFPLPLPPTPSLTYIFYHNFCFHYILFRNPCTHLLYAKELKYKYLSTVKKMQVGIFIVFSKHTINLLSTSVNG